MKLRLDTESLKVESFAAEPAANGRGTVQAHESGAVSDCVCPFSAPWTNCTDCTCNDVCA
jgi:hypothetical protein